MLKIHGEGARRFRRRWLSGFAIIAATCMLATSTDIAAAAPPAATLPVSTSQVIPQTPTPLPPDPAPPAHFYQFHAAEFTAQAANLPTQLITALQRDLSETGAQYLAKAAAARQANAVVDQLRTNGVDVLGSHLSGTNLNVNVSNAHDAAAVVAVGATPILGKPISSLASQHIFRAATTANILGGSGYWFEEGDYVNFCSVGFNGHDTWTDQPQFLTAGHCFQGAGPLTNAIRAGEWTTPQSTIVVPTTGAVIGTPAPYSIAFGNGGDHALVNETGSDITMASEVSTWGGTVPVAGQAVAVVGADLCKSGMRTGWTCGTVVGVDQLVDVLDDENGHHDVNSVIATTCVLPGDSGGAGMTGNYAVGVTSGSSFSSSCTETGEFSAYYTMVSDNGGNSVDSQLPEFELGVSLSTPVVTSVADGGEVAPDDRIRGTLANPAAGDMVCLYIDSTAYIPSCDGVNPDGTWDIALQGGWGVGNHTYYVQATYGHFSFSAVGSGDFVIPVSSTASGTMKNTTGIKLSGRVLIYKTGAAAANTGSFVNGYTVANGHFTIPHLLVGSYKLAFVMNTVRPVNIDHSPGTSDPYVTQWYSGQYSYASSDTVTITSAGQVVTGIDVVMQNPAFADAADPTSAFYDYIQWMSSAGLSSGTVQPTGKPLYQPSTAVSRQAMAAFLYRLSGITFTAPVEPTFADVPTDSAFYTAIEWMAHEGISTGTSQPSGKPLFKAGGPVSRSAMALFLARYKHADVSGVPTTQRFADVPPNSSPVAAINWMWDNNISTGTTQPSGLPLYKPSDPVSRQAMAAFLYRIANLP